MIKKTIIALTLPFLISSCATIVLLNKTTSKKITNEIVELEDQIIAIGRPNVPIPNYPNTLVLAGLKNSYLITPFPSARDPQDLFQKIYQYIDLNHIYLDPNNQIADNFDQHSKNIKNIITFDLRTNIKQETLINSKLGIYYINNIDNISGNDKKNLKDLGFECKNINYKESHYYLCNRTIHSTIQIATQVGNI